MSDDILFAENPFRPTLEPVDVPRGYFPIEVVQFWRGECKPRVPLPLHWSIVVRTSDHVGNCHEIVGDATTYATQDRQDLPLRLLNDGDEDWRGGHVVGYVSPARMDDLSNHIGLVPLVHHDVRWNCQNWVYDALQGLGQPDMYVDAKLTFARLQAQMMYLLEAWEVGDI